MVQTLIGAEKFRAGMDLYFARHDGEAATVEQFIQCFADATGRDLTQFMRWYSQAGTPEVTVAGRYDAARKTYTLDCKQSVPPTPGQPTKAADGDPAGARPGRQGRPRPAAHAVERRSIERGVLVLSEPAHTFEFTGIAERPVLSINRGFSAPIKLVTDLDADDLDLPRRARQRCVQPLAGAADHLDAAADRQCGRAACRQARRATTISLIAALAAILDDAKLEPAFVALALVPPGEGDIAREIGRDIDPDAIYRRAHGACAPRSATGSARRSAKTYDRMTVPGPYSPDAASAGRRALRNVALDLLAATGQARRHRARRAAIRRRRQHDRPHGGAGDAVRCTPRRSASGRSPISTRATPPTRW